MKTIDVTSRQREILVQLLQRHLPNVEVWAYGSRVTGTARPNSDLDLVAFADAGQRSAVMALRDALDESNLPFLVDLHVWNELPESFQENIRTAHMVLLPEDGCE